jgi:hypothetical protein
LGLLLYLNAASLLEAAGARVHLPRPWYASRPLQIFSLFGYYVTENFGYEAHGRPVSEKNKEEPEWIEIDPYSFFPQTLGEANRRLLLFSFQGDLERKRKTYPMMAERMKALYNRSHPDNPIDRIQLYEVRWPVSPLGFRAEYAKRTWTVLHDG